MPILLPNPKFHYSVHKDLPLDPTVSHMNTVQTLAFFHGNELFFWLQSSQSVTLTPHHIVMR